MPKILFVTVGGSPKPILTAIDTLKPDRVIFICSAGKKGSESQVIGENKPCKVIRGGEIVEELPNLPTAAGLNQFDCDRDLIRIDNPDDLAEGYQRIAQVIRQIREDSPEADLLADYTGGTKPCPLPSVQLH